MRKFVNILFSLIIMVCLAGNVTGQRLISDFGLSHQRLVPSLPKRFLVPKAGNPSALRGPFPNVNKVYGTNYSQSGVPKGYLSIDLNQAGYITKVITSSSPTFSDTLGIVEYTYYQDSVFAGSVQRDSRRRPTFERQVDADGRFIRIVSYDTLGRIRSGSDFKRNPLGNDTIFYYSINPLTQQSERKPDYVITKLNGRRASARGLSLSSPYQTVDYQYDQLGRPSLIRYGTITKDSIVYRGDSAIVFGSQKFVRYNTITKMYKTDITRAKTAVENHLNRMNSQLDLIANQSDSRAAEDFYINTEEYFADTLVYLFKVSSRPVITAGTLVASIQNYTQIGQGVFYVNYDSIAFSTTPPLALGAKLADQKLGISPNPGSNNLTIVGLNTPANVRILSIDGREVLTAKNDGATAIPTANLAAGVYVVEVNDGESVRRERWVKE